MLASWSLVVLGSVAWLGPPAKTPVERVVTVAPSLTQTVLALGAGERLVGVSRFDDAPEVASLARVGGFNDPNVEAIVALRPSVVVVQRAPGNQQPVERLASLGLSVLVLSLTTVADVKEAIEALGAAVGKQSEARQLVEAIVYAEQAMRARHGRGSGPKVLVVYGFSPFVVAGPGSFAHELLEDCGAVNVAGKAPTPYPTFSLERALAFSPDVIVDASDSSEGRAQVQALPPLKKARWVPLPSRALLQPGPGLAQGLRALCQSLESSGR